MQRNLNALQKQDIDALICGEYGELKEITNLEPLKAIQALRAIIVNRPLTPNEINQFIHQNVYSNIFTIRKILSHPCPQNRNRGDAGAADALTGYPRENGIYNGKVYFWKPATIGLGEEARIEMTIPDCEDVGLLGLTARNDGSTPPPIKEDVVQYIKELINNEILEQEKKCGMQASSSSTTSNQAEVSHQENMQQNTPNLHGIGTNCGSAAMHQHPLPGSSATAQNNNQVTDDLLLRIA